MTYIEGAAVVGRSYARRGRPIDDCPYDANGTPEQRAMAARFVQGYVAETPDGVDVDLTDDPE